MTPEQNMWFPGLEYTGREGDYAKKIADVSLVEVTRLVKTRAQEDGEWAIHHGLVGTKEDLMRQMMEWVSRDENIQQAMGHIVRAGEEEKRTVDYVCRDLASAAKAIGGSSG